MHGTPNRFTNMLIRLLLLFTVVPMVELALLMKLADATDWRVAFALVLLTGIVGAALARYQGIRCWQRVQQKLAAGELPGDPLLDALMILIAGALLVTPGILTDAVGFSLLLPPVRRLIRDRLKRRFRAQFHMQWPPHPQPPPGGDRIIETRIVEEDREET